MKLFCMDSNTYYRLNMFLMMATKAAATGNEEEAGNWLSLIIGETPTDTIIVYLN
jgi:hypothetical protein